jgi:hypothetical protein
MEKQYEYEVHARIPSTGVGSSFDSRRVGPFESRRLAEEAAARMVDDPRRWQKIEIVTLDGNHHDKAN